MSTLNASRFTLSVIVAAAVAVTGCSKSSSDPTPATDEHPAASANVPATAPKSVSPVAPVAAVGCTGTPVPSPFKGSCDFGAGVACQEFTGSGFTPAGDGYGAKKGCDSAKAKYSSTKRCPTAGLIGRCMSQCGDAAEILNFHYVGDEASAKASCLTTHGAWLSK